MKIPLTPVRFLYRAIDLYGEKIGIVCGGHRDTYSVFGERCEKLAGGLAAEGVRPGDRVAYLSLNNRQLLEGYYGVPLSRAILVPLNVRLTAAELIEILNHCEPRILVFETDFAPLIDAFRKSCPALKRYISIDSIVPQADFTYEELLSKGRIDRPDLFSFDEDAIAELFYTSGSTGSPKGVMLGHRTLYLHALSVLPFFNERDTGVELHTIPLFHANGWGRPHTSTMNGLKQVMVRRFDPENVLRLIQEERATSMSLVPTMANALLNCANLGNFDVSSMLQITIGGAASSPELIMRMERAFGRLVHAGYGLTETAPAVSTSIKKSTLEYAGEDDRVHRQTMAGWPFIGTEIRVVDTEMKDVPRDMHAIGEVVVRSDNVMDGYFKDPAATAAVMSGGWFHTGDMAVWDKENYIHIVDRKKDIIISGGENISSIEVEKAIFAHPAVLECAVVSAPDSKWGEIPIALIVLKPNQQLSEEELLVFLQTRLAKFKLPRVIRFEKEPLPKTGTGKILKRELREPFWAGKEKRVQGV
jgi:fatty-acyl-CoA synthase